MTSITAIGSSAPLPPAVQTLVSAPPATSPAVSPRTDTVTISVSPGTLSASAHPSDTAAEQRVNSLVEDVRTHNDIADAKSHIAWDAYANVIGQDKVDILQAQLKQSLDYSTAHIDREFGESGINIAPASDNQAAQTGLAPGSLLVSNFSFKSGGSTYAMIAGNDGTLVGTRDGQPWKTWKITPTHITQADPGVITALTTLQKLLSTGQPSTPSGSAGSLKIDA